MNREKRASTLATLATEPPVEQLRSPLDFLFAEHFRQRILCGMLDEITEEETDDAEEVGAVVDFLTGSLRLHVRDEDEDLFPMLRRRAGKDDRIGELLSDLSEEHVADGIDARTIVAGLSCLGAAAPGAEFCKLLRRFSANERRHLITENAIVMPMARALLTHRDLEELGRRMAMRRGWIYPEGAEDE